MCKHCYCPFFINYELYYTLWVIFILFCAHSSPLHYTGVVVERSENVAHRFSGPDVTATLICNRLNVRRCAHCALSLHAESS